MISKHIIWYQYCFPCWKAGKLKGLIRRDYLYRLLLIGSAWIYHRGKDTMAIPFQICNSMKKSDVKPGIIHSARFFLIDDLGKK